MTKRNKTKMTIGTLDDYIKANRIGRREAELEFANGFVSMHKIHKSKKVYNRQDNKRITIE